jgi:hypothetical protein
MPLALPIAMLIVALLVGSGGLAVFLKYGTRVALVEHDSEKNVKTVDEHTREIQATKTRVEVQEQTLKEIRDSLTRLHVIDSMKTTVDVVSARLEDTRKETQQVKDDLRVFIQTVTKERVDVARNARKARKKRK